MPPANPAIDLAHWPRLSALLDEMLDLAPSALTRRLATLGSAILTRAGGGTSFP